LAHLERLDLLTALFPEIYIPPAVVKELEIPHTKLPPILVSSMPFLRIKSPANSAKVRHLRTLIDAGEAEALALALELNAAAVLIDE
jgi:predicted nucleic acid-binding protein